MVRPVSFGFNEQTAESNSFQNKDIVASLNSIQENALNEFDTLVNKLKNAYIDVIVFEDTQTPHTPDSIFPNNWISFHENNSIVIYPMLAENRRKERRKDIIKYFTNNQTTLIDISNNELKNNYLEGTGSIVFDYENKIAYANISPRTNKVLFETLCEKLGYKAISFTAVDTQNKDIYHTNVLMCIGNSFAVLCKECIPDKTELKNVCESLEKTNHTILEISYSQMNSFCGNMYQMFNKTGESFILMSEQAYKALSIEQIKALEKHGQIIHSPLFTIEKYGGGSARCMIADVRL
jgi:hypothetical protein